MSTRIVWNTEEKAAHYERLVSLFKSNPGLNSKVAFREAQDVLAYDRHRKITDGTVFTHKEMLLKARAEAKQRPVPQPEPVKAPEPAEMSLGELFEKLVDEITRRVTIEVRNALARPSVIVERGYAEDRPAGNAAHRERLLSVKPSNPRKLSVLIVGLNGCQMSVMTSKYADIKFTFMTGEEAVSRNRLSADHTILMTKFINHSAQSKYRTAPNLHYCNGGVSDLSTLMHVIRREAV